MVVSSNYFIATYIQKQTTCKFQKKKKKLTPKDNKITTLLYFTYMEFLLFFTMPNFVKTVSPVRTSITVPFVMTLS